MAEEPVEYQAEAKIRRSQTVRVLIVLIILWHFYRFSKEIRQLRGE